jgi:hypothetical protein
MADKKKHKSEPKPEGKQERKPERKVPETIGLTPEDLRNISGGSRPADKSVLPVQAKKDVKKP